MDSVNQATLASSLPRAHRTQTLTSLFHRRRRRGSRAAGHASGV